MSKFLYLLSASLIPALALPASAAAQSSPSEQVLEEILADQGESAPVPPEERSAVVFADRTASPITVTATGFPASTDETGQAVTVIARDEIEAIQGPDVARVLTRVPGVTTTRTGSLGAQSSTFVRGGSNEQLLVLIDGVRVSDPAAPSGGFDFGTLTTASLGKVDLLRGSNSTIWGSDAVSGVLDVSTRGRPGLGASAEYGARDTVFVNAAGGLEGDGYFAGLSAGYVHTDGFSSAASGTEKDGFEQISVSGSGFVDLTDRLEAFVQARYADSDLDIDGFPAPTFALGDTLETQETRQYSGAVGLAYYGQDLTLRGSYSLADTSRDNFDRTVSQDPAFASDGHLERVDIRGEYRLIGGLVLAFGGARERTDYSTDTSAGDDATITGGYLQAGWVLGGLAAHLGARLDDHDRFGSEVSLGGDVSYALGTGGWRVRASAGEGFKAPTLFQLYSDFGNLDLQPERSTSVDVGVERGERGRGLHLAATLFRRDSENLIGFASCFGNTAPVCGDGRFGYYENIDRARAQGIELEAGADVVEGLRVAGVYSLIDAENRGTDLDLARRPRHAATLYADYVAPFGLTLGVDLRLVGDSFENAANTVELDSYTTLDLRAEMPVGEAFSVFGRVENVFDEDYQTAAGYAQAGRGAFVGVRARM